MKRTTIYLFLTIVFFVSCKKSDSPGSSGTFTLSVVGGSTYSAKYVDKPYTQDFGTFTLEHQSDNDGSIWLFTAYFDDKNETEADLKLQFDEPIVNGKKYIFPHTQWTEEFIVSKLSIYRSTAVFESSTYPGQIIGKVEGYDQSGKLICTASFDFKVN